MKNKTLFKKVLCVLLAMTITGTSFAIAFGQKENKDSNVQNSIEATQASTADNSESKDSQEKSGIKKEETVYVNLDPNGNIYSQIVSNRLHSEDSNVVVKDKSDLDNIIPIKGGSLKKNKNGELEWSIDQNDIYYRGTTERKMPMSVDISYFLDGKEYKPEKLAGKSGKLRIEISVKNNQSQTVTICGKKTKIYSPLVVMLGAVLKDDVFSNVNVDEGNVTVDGSNFVVSMTAMPGLNETLNMKNMSIEELKDIEFYDNFVITADVKDFEMGPIAVVASTEFPDVDTKGTTIDDMKVDLVDLQNMQNDLENMDGDHEIRSLFTDTKKSDAARLLVDDIFELYDLNRTILDILPKYVTHDNVKNLEHFIDDIELVDLDELEDSEVLDYLEELLVKNEDPIDFDELKVIFKDTNRIMDYIKDLDDSDKVALLNLKEDILKLKEEANKIEEVAKTNPQLMGMLQTLVKSGGMKKVIETSLNEAIDTGVDAAVDATFGIKKSAPITMDKIIMDLPTEDTVTDGISSEDKKADTKTDTDNGSKTETSTGTDTTVKPPADSTESEDKKPSTETDTPTNPPVNSEVKPPITGMDTDSSLTPSTDITKSEADSTKEEKPADDKTTTDVSTIEIKKDVLAANTFDNSATKSNTQPTPDQIQGMKIQIKNMLGTLTEPTTDVIMDLITLPDNAKALVNVLTKKETIDQLDGMVQYFTKNEKNIDLMIKIFDATDSRQAKRIARTASHLRDTIHDFKPQLFNLQRDIKKPGMRESLRESPEMIRTLVKMNGDLEDNRNISDILKRAVSEENSNTVKSMIETLDRLMEKDAIGTYLGNVDDIKELLERKDALVELSNNQGAYSGSTDDAETSVRFIMKTDEIKKPEVKKEIEPVKEKPKGKIRSFFEKIFD